LDLKAKQQQRIEESDHNKQRELLLDEDIDYTGAKENKSRAVTPSRKVRVEKGKKGRTLRGQQTIC